MFGKTLRFRGKKFKQNLPKIFQKVLKWPLQYVNFQKFSGGTCPRTPLELFVLSICFKIILSEKNTLENNYVKIWCPLPEKILECAADMKTFFKGLFTPLWRLTSL